MSLILGTQKPSGSMTIKYISWKSLRHGKVRLKFNPRSYTQFSINTYRTLTIDPEYQLPTYKKAIQLNWQHQFSVFWIMDISYSLIENKTNKQ